MILNPVTDCRYPCYDPFEEPFDYEAYDDPDEALAASNILSRRKRYMFGMFPGVDETSLLRDAIREFLLLVQLYDGYNV